MSLGFRYKSARFRATHRRLSPLDFFFFLNSIASCSNKTMKSGTRAINSFSPPTVVSIAFEEAFFAPSLIAYQFRDWLCISFTSIFTAGTIVGFCGCGSLLFRRFTSAALGAAFSLDSACRFRKFSTCRRFRGQVGNGGEAAARDRALSSAALSSASARLPDLVNSCPCLSADALPLGQHTSPYDQNRWAYPPAGVVHSR